MLIYISFIDEDSYPFIVSLTLRYSRAMVTAHIPIKALHVSILAERLRRIGTVGFLKASF